MLGRAMGFTDPAFHETEEEMMARALDFPDNPYLNGVTLDKLKEHRYVKLDMTPLETYLDRLPTPSGRIELYSRSWRKQVFRLFRPTFRSRKVMTV